ncbi:MAG: hypothetical protein C5B58_09365 [Acidobacteria bacterium]|nr:MAG: hypothetical protein C5B58_09365 [Acidobacteriota bacterium]
MLPSNWTKILESIDATLTRSIELAQAREAAQSELATGDGSPIQVGDFSQRFEELDRRADRLSEPLLALDQALKDDEESVRQHLASVEELSRTLANWVGGAVG